MQTRSEFIVVNSVISSYSEEAEMRQGSEVDVPNVIVTFREFVARNTRGETRNVVRLL